MKLGDLVVGIGANTKKLDEQLGKAQRRLKYFGKNTKALGKSLTMGVTAPLAVMGATSVRAFQVQAKAIAQVEAGLKSTGNQVGLTSKQLQAMASDLQSKTLFGDETILKDATAQLITFTNISGEQFARTQQAALDLATRLDGDLKGASIQLGKALNDPVANLSALSRSGIQFSDEQKEVIKSMAETGRLAEAQTIILDELDRQYGGSAEAAADADGGFTQLANSFGDLQEAIGQQLIPILRPLVDWLTQTVAKLQDAPDSFKRTAVVIGLVAGAIGPLLVVIPSLVGGVKTLVGVVGKLNLALLANPYVIAAAAIAAVGYAIYKVATHTDAAGKAANRMKDAMAQAAGQAAKETVKVQVLAKQYKRAGDNLEERRKVMQKIKELSPQYFGNLDAEKSSYEDITTAIQDYNKAMFAKAMQAAMEGQLQEMAAERVEILMEQNEHLTRQQELENKIAKAKEDVANGDMSRVRAGAMIAKANIDLRVQTNHIAVLDRQLADHDKMMNTFIDSMMAQTEATEENTVVTDENAEAAAAAAAAAAEAAAAEAALKSERAAALAVMRAEADAMRRQIELRREFNALMREDILSGGPVDQGARIDAMPDELSGLQDIPSIMDDFESDFTVDEIAFEKFQKTERIMNGFRSVGQAVFQSLAENASHFGNQMGQAFGAMARGAEDGKERMKEATRGIINQALAAAQATIIEAMISSGKFSGPAAPIVIPALVAGGIGLVQSLFADIPAFAQGGIVSGPTVGLMGEYPGAKSNPEVIAPLNKLQSMLQAGKQQVVVSGRIDGNAIRLANDRTNRNAKRFLR